MRSCMLKLSTTVIAKPPPKKIRCQGATQELVDDSSRRRLGASHDPQIEMLTMIDTLMSRHQYVPYSRQHWAASFIPAEYLGSLSGVDVTVLHLATMYNLTGYVNANVPKDAPGRYNSSAAFHSSSNSTNNGESQASSLRMRSLLGELGVIAKPESRRRVWRRSLFWSRGIESSCLKQEACCKVRRVRGRVRVKLEIQQPGIAFGSQVTF